MTVYVIVENIDFGDDVIEAICPKLGYYTDAYLAEKKVADLNGRLFFDAEDRFGFIPLEFFLTSSKNV